MDVNKTVAQLIDQWCERRALGPLRYILNGWPHNGLTDGLAILMDSLEKVRGLAREDLTPEEEELVDHAISILRRAVYRS